MEKRFIFISLILFIFLINFVSSAPPFTSITFDSGFKIETPQFDSIQLLEDHQFDFHIKNTSNGVIITDSSASCLFHLFNRSGSHLIDNKEISFDVGGVDFEIIVNGNNFSNAGQYCILVNCNSSNQGGDLQGCFEVTPTGKLLTIQESYFYIIILIISFIVAVFFGFLSWRLPYENDVNVDGSITEISKSKYFKMLFAWFSVGFSMWFLQVLTLISNSFMGLRVLSNSITVVFLYSGRFSYVFTVFILILIFYNGWRDLLWNKVIREYGKAFIDGRII